MLRGSPLSPLLILPALLFAAGFALVLITEGVALPGSVSFVTATDEHDGGLYDSDYALREAITAANAYASSAGIPFSVTARSTVVVVLTSARLIGQFVRRNCRGPTILEKVSKPCGTYL